MKKTLEEEKDRILTMMGKINEQMLENNLNDIDVKIKSVVNNIFDNFDNLTRQDAHDMIKELIEPDSTSNNDDNELNHHNETYTHPHETDEYANQYSNNMTQGFKNEVKEGNAFIAAANKAKEAGKNTFDLGGKTYDVKK
jgi:hypothetical protein